MDAIALLTRDHREVEQLFKQFDKLTGRATKSKKNIVMKLIRERRGRCRPGTRR